MSGVSCVIFYAGKMLQTIEFPLVALNINLFEGPLASRYDEYQILRGKVAINMTILFELVKCFLTSDQLINIETICAALAIN
jgi:hypothetical protein